MHEGNHRILDAFTEEERDELVTRGVPRVLARGQTLYYAGEATSRLHVLLDGLIKLVGRDPQGNETIVGLALPGELIGEIAALDGGVQPTDAVAAVPARLIGFDAATLLDALTHRPGAALELAQLLARRNRWSFDIAMERASSEVAGRLAGRLLDLAKLLGRDEGESISVELPLGQQDLARLAGMCRESACKTLRGFKRSGLVDYRGRKLRILRPDALEKIRCGGRAVGPFRSEDGEGPERSRPTVES